MKRRKLIAILGCLLLGAGTAAISAPAQKHPQTQKAPPKAHVTSLEIRGQQVFQENCHRCHQWPGDIPPRISGTVAKHMRVIARLNDNDYKALLKFLNQ